MADTNDKVADDVSKEETESSSPKKRSLEETTENPPAKQRRPDEISIKLLVPNVVCGALLSKRTSALRRIKEQCGRELEIVLSEKDKFYPGTSRERIISLRGPELLVHRACCLVHDQVIDDPYLNNDTTSNESEIGPRQGHIKLIVSDRGASKIIGTKGSVIKAISYDFDIVITITPHTEMKIKNERLVTIIGPSRNIYDALQHIVHQVALQPDQLNPGFEQYDGLEPEEEEKKEEESDEKNPQTKCEDENVASAENKEAEPKNNENPTNESADKNGDSEEPKEATEESKAENDKTKEDEEKEADKKSLRTDGRWTWQLGPNKKPAWVWQQDKKNNAKNAGRNYEGYHYYGGYNRYQGGRPRW